jgi:hypothetical protein
MMAGKRHSGLEGGHIFKSDHHKEVEISDKTEPVSAVR